MSLQAKIISLLSGVNDPALRMDVATTIMYLFQIYSAGAAKEEEIRQSLFEVCLDVVRFTRPALTEEEARDEAERLAEAFIRIFRVQGVRQRVGARFPLRRSIGL